MGEETVPVSVIICAYNAERYVAKSIASVLDQTYDNVEVVVVDDASTDATAAIANEIAQRDRRVRLVRRSTNGGLAQARMTGLENTRHDLTVFLDADDVALPRMIERQVVALRNDANVIGVATYAYYVSEDETVPLGVQEIGPTTRETALEMYERDKLMFLPATTLCRKSMVMAAGGFRVTGFPTDEGVRYQDYCDDLDLWCRLADLGRERKYFITIPEPLFLYRKTAHSLSAKNVFAMQEKMRWIKACLKRRRQGLPEQPFLEYRGSIPRWARLANRVSDGAALTYKRMTFSYLNRRYVRAALYFFVVCVLSPRLIAQKMKTQSLRLRK